RRVPRDRGVEVVEQPGARHVHLADQQFLGWAAVDAQAPFDPRLLERLLGGEPGERAGRAEHGVAAAVAVAARDERVLGGLRLLREAGQRVVLGEDADDRAALTPLGDEGGRHVRDAALDAEAVPLEQVGQPLGGARLEQARLRVAPDLAVHLGERSRPRVDVLDRPLLRALQPVGQNGGHQALLARPVWAASIPRGRSVYWRPEEGVTETRPTLRIARGRPRLLDAPVGAELVRRGVRWRKHGLLTDADAVRQVHVEMLEAGAELIRTNTLGLNGRIFLDVFKSPAHMAHIGAPGLDTLAPRLAARAVEIAREAREQAGYLDVPVAAVLSPLEHVFRPDLVPESEVAQREHADLARAMADAGADLFYVDALTTLRETRAVLDAVQPLGLPVIAAFVVDERGDLLGGDALGVALARLGRCEAVVLTGAPLEDLLLGLAAIGATPMPLGLAPICGYHDPPSWKFDFHPRFGGAPAPEAFASELVAALPADAAIVGAWCGAGPEHISALRTGLPWQWQGVEAGRAGVWPDDGTPSVPRPRERSNEPGPSRGPAAPSAGRDGRNSSRPGLCGMTYAYVAERLAARRPLILDGAIGTEILRRDLTWADHQNLARPDVIRALHVASVTAGADVISTNTFQLSKRSIRNHFRDA